MATNTINTTGATACEARRFAYVSGLYTLAEQWVFNTNEMRITMHDPLAGMTLPVLVHRYFKSVRPGQHLQEADGFPPARE